VPTREALTSGVLDLILTAGPVAKAILVILALFSIVSWALIVEKWWQFRRVRRQTLAFLKVSREARTQAIVQTSARKLRDSPLAQLYVAAYNEAGSVRDVVDRVLDDGDELSPARLDIVQRALRRASTLEIARLERYLPFLATTASSTPFIGLFGTVWGIMSAFHGIGAQGSAIFADGARHEIPCVAPDAVLDPTGCGDAYRAGLLYGIARGWHWPSTGRLASVMGAIKIAHRGPQNHKPSRDEIAALYKKAFGASPF
jgi:biopolymer transport protein ExbB/TolQ